MSDVKVYVDLASISAGENDTEIDQVACFHDAVMGYAPLLYSLSPLAGFNEFMRCAQQVWDAQSRDEKLPDKLVKNWYLHLVSYFYAYILADVAKQCLVCFSERVYPVTELAKSTEGDSRLCRAVLTLLGFLY